MSVSVGSAIALAVVNMAGMAANAITGYGENIVFQICWYVLSLFGLSSGDLAESVVILTLVSVPLLLSQTVLQRVYLNKGLAALLALTSSVTAIGGVWILSISGDQNVWLQRGLGILFLVVFLIQLVGLVRASGKNADGQHFDTYSTCKHVTAATAAGLFAGFFGGLFSIPGPPTMILTLSFNIPKDEWRATNSLYVFLQLPVRVAATIFFKPPHLDYKTLWVQVAISLAGGAVGLAIGNLLAPRVSQAAFRRALLVFLLLGGISLATAGTPFTMYCSLAVCAGAVCVEIVLSFRRRGSAADREVASQRSRSMRSDSLLDDDTSLVPNECDASQVPATADT